MTKLTELWRRLIFAFRRATFDRELEEEIRFHLDLKMSDHIAEGATESGSGPRSREFGNATLVMEKSRDVWLIGPIENSIKDLRYAVRILTKNWTFTVTALSILTLGIGASTAVFSAVDAVLIRPLAVSSQSRLVLAWKRDTLSDNPVRELSTPEFRDWQAQNHVFSAAAALPTSVYGYGYTVIGQGEPFQVESARVSAGFFSVLGVRAKLGRVFNDDEDRPGATKTVVLSHSLWRNRFNSDPTLVGRQLTMSGDGYTVVGVMPADFDFPSGADLWTPLSTN
ncbi:MAG: ABC transporter permease, partial [Blastocatellia bacterium]